MEQESMRKDMHGSGEKETKKLYSTVNCFIRII